MWLPRKLCPPIATRETRNEGAGVLGVEDRQTVGDHRAAADGGQVRRLVRDLGAEVGAGLLDLREVVADGPQVGDDVRAVAAQPLEEPDVGHAGDRALHGVVEAVERIDPVGPEGQVQQPWQHGHGDQTEEQETGEEGDGQGERLGVEGPRRQFPGVRLQQRVERRYDVHQQERAADAERDVHQQRLEQCHQGVAGPAPGGAVGGRDPDVVHRGGTGRGAVPAFARGDRRAAVQRGGVAQLAAVADRGADVEDGLLADEDVPAEGDGAGADPARVRPVAEEQSVLADDRARADGQQVGGHRNRVGQDRHARADAGAEGPQVEDVQRVAPEQDHRVGAQECPDEPEADVGEAPHRELRLLPPADQHPLRDHGQRAQREEQGAAEDQ